MGLQEYKAKRDFRQTAEPSGGKRGGAGGRALSFVIQKHDASHLHYDFRLEMEGVLKSWAVPKGVPLKRGDRRLAVEVEDHPLEYGGFEGTIAEGNYGAGTVMVWDRGTYRTFDEDPIRALKDGKIHFVLEGKKLKGEWTLVRMRHAGGTKPQWLLLKSGKDLPPLSERTESRSVLSGRSMEQIGGAGHGREWQSNRVTRARVAPPRLGRTRRSVLPGHRSPARGSGRRGSTGLARSTQSKRSQPAKLEIDLGRLPASEPRFIEPMKALLVESLPKGPEWLYEIKFDGVRAVAIKDKDSVELISRSGKDLGQKYPAVLQALKELPVKQAVVDGEVVALDEQGRSAFQLLQSFHTAGRKAPLFYYVFDLLHLEGKDLTGLPLWRRKEMALKFTQSAGRTLRFSDNIQADSARLMKEMQARGLEGLVGKKRNSTYEPGRRSGAWIKFKWTNEQEFVIGGYTRPKGARSHFGAILVGYYENRQLRFAAKVGTGFNERALGSLYRKFQELTQPECPFVNLPERSSGASAGLTRAEMSRCTWIRPELVCQVRFAEWTRDHHLRQPAFLGLREDKRAREVVRDKPV